MLTLLIAVGAFVGYFIAYHTYGRWLSKKIFKLDGAAIVPSIECRDDVDYCPTNKHIIFGHHYTSIAGTGPIVGPAIAVFWGWLPALLWVVFGSIFIGAVHDLGSLVVSLRNRGQTVGEIAGRMIAPRVKYLFLLTLFFALTLVLAVFGLVIATIFKLYPASVLSVWVAMPVAVAIGLWARRPDRGLLVPSIIAVGILYAAVYAGVYYLPITLSLPAAIDNPVVVWTLILLVYCFFASVLPVWLLLQPRDYVNSHQLLITLGLLTIGLLVAGVMGQADINAAPAISQSAPADAPPIWPFLFITIACGAVSGFHCLVSSGTTSKQISSEPDAQFVGYGSMLMEGVLAVVVIMACCAGVGMGQMGEVGSRKSEVGSRKSEVGSANAEAGSPKSEVEHTTTTLVGGTPRVHAESALPVGRAAWESRYQPGGSWANFKLPDMVGAFVEGGANFITALGIDRPFAIGMIAVLVACFAATTLDTATRLQRYVIQELAAATRVKPLTDKYAATGLAVVVAGVIAVLPASEVAGYGTGGLILWPLFGATNQLLAGLAFMVVFFYLWRRGIAAWFIAAPMVLMLVMPAWALIMQMFVLDPPAGFGSQYHLIAIGGITLALQVWMVIEAILMIPRAKGVLESPPPPCPHAANATA